MLIVEMSNSHGNLDSVEFSAIFCETLGVSKVHEKLTTSDEPHHKENLLVRHENVAHSHKEWMISLEQNIFLKLRWLNLVVIDDYVLAKRFHSVNLASVFLLHQKDLSEASSANNFFDLEVCKRNVGVAVFCKSWLALERC